MDDPFPWAADARAGPTPLLSLHEQMSRAVAEVCRRSGVANPEEILSAASQKLTQTLRRACLAASAEPHWQSIGCSGPVSLWGIPPFSDVRHALGCTQEPRARAMSRPQVRVRLQQLAEQAEIGHPPTVEDVVTVFAALYSKRVMGALLACVTGPAAAKLPGQLVLFGAMEIAGGFSGQYGPNPRLAFQDQGSFLSYVRRIARSLIWTYYRKSGGKDVRISDAEIEDEGDDAA